MPPRLSYTRPRIRKSRGRGLRTTSGCITCRKRHLKCDEVKPICGPCARKDKPCEYSTTGRRSTNISALDETISDVVPSPVSQRKTPPGVNGHSSSGVIQDSVPSETADLSWSCVEPGVNHSSPTLLDNLSGTPLDQNQSPIALQTSYLSPYNTSGAASRWLGLLAGDAARDSPQLLTIPNFYANQNPPDTLIQHSSLQNATQALGSSPISNPSNDLTGSNVPGDSTLGEKQSWQPQESIELLPTEQTLFEYFINKVSPWIDLFDPTSQFSTFVAHLAIHNAGLMNAILALAFRHLALNPWLDEDNVPHKEEAALQYYYQTLYYVQRAMQYPSYQKSLELLATTLIISAYEMLDNSTNDWERHLEGVFLIQRSQTIHGESGGLQAAVWWAWLCQDVWAAVREKRKTFTFWIPQKQLSTLSPHELARRAIYITAKVVNFYAETTTEENIEHQINEATRLRTMLYDWRQHLTVEFSPLPLRVREEATCFQPIWIRPPAFGMEQKNIVLHYLLERDKLTESMGVAVAIQFFSVSHILLLAHEPSMGGLDQYIKRQSMIKRCVENICGISMALKDAASSLMSSQALFIAGMFAQESRAREAILELLDSCRQRTGWPVRSLGVELQQFWESTDTDSHTQKTKLYLP